MISGGIKVNKFAQITLMAEAKSGDDNLPKAILKTVALQTLELFRKKSLQEIYLNNFELCSYLAL